MLNSINSECWEQNGRIFFQKGMELSTAFSDEDQINLFKMEDNS